MTYSSLGVVTVLLSLFLGYRGATRILHQNLLPNRFNFVRMREGISEICRIHRQTFNAEAELFTGNSNHLSIQFQKVRSINKGYNHCFKEVKTDQ